MRLDQRPGPGSLFEWDFRLALLQAAGEQADDRPVQPPRRRFLATDLDVGGWLRCHLLADVEDGHPGEGDLLASGFVEPSEQGAGVVGIEVDEFAGDGGESLRVFFDRDLENPGEPLLGLAFGAPLGNPAPQRLDY